MKPLLLTLAFILEIVAFAAFFALGYVFTSNPSIRVVMFILLFILLVGFWSVFMAPRASRKLSPRPYYLAKAIIYAISAFVLFRLFGSMAGLAFVVVCLSDELLLARYKPAV